MPADFLKRQLVTWPDPILTQVARRVPEGQDCRELIELMRKVMIEHKGVGLAAPQVGESLRIIVGDCGGEFALINPRIVKASEQMHWSYEGCLSFPKTCPRYAQDMSLLKEGDSVRVRRHKRIKVKAFNEAWEPITLKGSDLFGNCLQHEIDHLNGITLDDHRRR